MAPVYFGLQTGSSVSGLDGGPGLDLWTSGSGPLKRMVWTSGPQCLDQGLDLVWTWTKRLLFLFICYFISPSDLISLEVNELTVVGLSRNPEDGKRGHWYLSDA